MTSNAKVAVVTGGGQGIGKAIARYFLQEGFAVVIAERDEEAGRETVTEYQTLGSIQFIPTDVADEQSVKHCMDRTVEAFDRLDALINNAAIANPENAPIEQLSLSDWNDLLSVNLTGAFLCTKYAIPYLRFTQGAIVNIASTRALMSEPDTEAYSAAKGGLVSLTHALANSLGPEIRVNCISPGWIDTSDWQKQSSGVRSRLTTEDHQQHPVGRVGKPEDIAAMAFYLVSESASFITGANFVIDGGMTKKMIYI